jgi:1-acyl-sn-glycerol-3-phosphate acyltransferase
MFFSILLSLFFAIHLLNIGKKYFEECISIISLLMLQFLDFKINMDSLKNVPSKCIIVMSHTSIYDFVICSMIYHAYFKKRLHIYFMMKEEFGAPANEVCSRIFPYTHVIPVGGEAVHSQNIVRKVVDELKSCDNYALCIAPEGTRRPVEHIRSGFYYIARDLGIPVVYCGINFSTKEVFFEKGRKMGPYIDEEKKWFIEMCRKHTPLYPENCYYTANYYANLQNKHFADFLNGQEQNNDDSSSYFEGVNIMNQLNQEVYGRRTREESEEKEENDSISSYDSYLSNIESYSSS